MLNFPLQDELVYITQQLFALSEEPAMVTLNPEELAAFLANAHGEAHDLTRAARVATDKSRQSTFLALWKDCRSRESPGHY